MKQFSLLVSRIFAKIPRYVRKRRVPIWLCVFVITGVALYGFSKLHFDQTTDGWFRDDDPVKVALDDFKAEFGSDDGIYIIYKPKDGDLFSAKSLEVVQSLCDDIINARAKAESESDENSPLGHIVRITSLTNASILEATEDMLIAKTLLENEAPSSQKDLDTLRGLALSQKSFDLAYYSKDLLYGGILIETDFGAIPVDFDASSQNAEALEDEMIDLDGIALGEEGQKVRFKPTDTQDYVALMNAITTVLDDPKYAEHLEFHPVGNAVQAVYDAEAFSQMGLLYLGMIIIMIVVIWLIFRSFSAVVWSFVIIILSTIWTLGFSGLFGFTMTFFMMLTVMMLLATGMSDTIHILSQYIYYRKEGYNHKASLHWTFKKVILACILTTVTTMVGFVALAVSPIVHIKVFGITTAIGILIELLITIFVMPLMLDVWRPARKTVKAKKTKEHKKISFSFSHFIQKRLDNLLPVVEKYKMGILVFFTVILVLCIYGASKTTSSFNMMENYDEESELRKSYEIVDNYMMGTQTMEVFLDLKEANAFQDPFVLSKIDELQRKIETKYSGIVLRTYSLVDVIKDANQKLNEGQEVMYAVPENDLTVSQVLFMFNNVNPSDRRRLVSDDYAKSHITVNLKNSDAGYYKEVFGRMQKDINEIVASIEDKYPETKLTLTGTLAMMMEASTYVAESTGGSLMFAVLVISGILLLIFGSIKVGLIAIVPNLIPSILSYAILGWFNIPLDMNTLLIGPIIIGVAVDDTIHFLTHYRSEIAIDGNIKRSLQAALKEAGQAVVFSTCVMGLGFAVLGLANGPVAITGIIGSIAIFSGLVCELFLLPASILIFKPTFGVKKNRPSMEIEKK